MKKKANIKVFNTPLITNFRCPGCGQVLCHQFTGMKCQNVGECKYKHGTFDVPTVPMFWTANELSHKAKRVRK